MESESQYSDFDIAIIGMAGRFPKAKNLDQYWRNLVDGTDGVTWFTREELQESGVEPELLDDPNYVPAAPVLEDADRFDAEFFGYSPKEAKSIDPQQRQLLECGWLAFENAGYDPGAFDGRIGVFAGTAMNTYFVNSGLHQEFNRDYLPTLLGSDKDFLATRLSYKLGLQGPALTIQTACSTSLVAIHYAIQSLLSGESDMTLVTAAAVRAPLKTGHLYEDASVFTKDGRCRAFDADATGTIFGSGVGGVVLKQAVKAEADGDNIRAIIRGSAVNNDGNEKSDFTAPSVSMQAAAITEAMAAADVTADTIDYVEAHGTGTYLGDPIEVAALTQAYSADTDKTGFAKIGSVKSNVGHLDAAAGMASLIKVVLSLENEVLPKTLHFEKPNPQIDFGSTPFVPAAINTPWPRGERRRRAGITSLGMGGTNAHIIVEEGQPTATTDVADEEAAPPLVLTAKTKVALDQLSAELGHYLEANPDVAMADVAHSLNHRAPLREKRLVFGADRTGLIETLKTKNAPLAADLTGAPQAPDGETAGDVVFLFTGQGSQRAGMGLGLYRSAEVFRDAVDRCAELFEANIGVDIRAEMWPGHQDPSTEPDEETVKAAQARLAETWLTQPTLFTIEYALAQWWLAEGVSPVAMLGHSIGELTAAAVAEVMSLEDTVTLVSIRAQSMFDCEPGSMMAVEADEEAIRPLLGDGIELAVQNSATSLVLAGSDQAIERLQGEMDSRDLAYRVLRTSHAFHTASMEPAAEKVAEAASAMTMAEPKIPVISNVSGTWYSDADRQNPRYWADQVRSTVRFADGLTALLEDAPAGQGARAFIELGPAATLTGLVTAHGNRAGHHQVRSTLPPRTGQVDDAAHAASTKSWLGVLGVITKPRMPSGVLLRSLPGYPFAGKSHWFTARNRPQHGGGGLSGLDLRSNNTDDWIHVESFAPAVGSLPSAPVSTLTIGTASATVQPLPAATSQPTAVPASGGRWTADGFKDHLAGLESTDNLPARILYHWATDDPTDQTVELLAIGQALTTVDLSADIELVVITEQMIDPIPDRSGGRDAVPTSALALGPVRVINQEMSTVSAKLVDVGAGLTADLFEAALAADDEVQVLAHGHRWTPQYLRASLPPSSSKPDGRKVALVGGFGGIGVELARHFVSRGDSVTLTSSRPLADDHHKTIEDLDADGRAGAATLSFGEQAEVEAALAKAAADMGGLDLIIHLGGVLDNGLLAKKDPDSARPVLYPKVEGSLQLLAAANQHDAELILFSSIAATHPEAGQVDYSAATAFQQALARDNGRVRAIAYPAWTGTGMTKQLSADGQAKAAVSGIDPASAIDALDRFLASDLPTIIVSPIPLQHLGLARKAPVGTRSAEPQADAMAGGEGLTATERKVAAIWNQLLGHDEIASTDQFPELGGTSLMAVKMFTQIDRQFGIELPVETVLEYPTLGDLAALLEAHGVGVTDDEVPAGTAAGGGAGANGSETSGNGSTGGGRGATRTIALPSTKPKIRVRVRPADGPPVYLVHAHGGTVLSYERLARHLRKDIDVIGFQSKGIDGVAEPLTTIEEMADLYIEELREHQPDGPYHVGGFCMGGTIAWEMAAKLAEQGEEVSNLFMIQAFSREYPEYRPDAKPSWIARMTRDQLSLARLDDDGGEITDVDTKAKANALVRGVKSKAYTTLMRLAEPVSTGRRTTLNRIGRINDNAFWNYAPRRLGVDVVYLPATIQPEGAVDDPTLGFGRFHDGQSIIRTVGGHFQGRFVEMDLESIAEELNSRIDP